MTYDEIHPALRNALGTHECFRKLGFPPKDIYVHRNPDGTFLMVVKRNGKQFAVTVGLVPYTQEEFETEWHKVVLAANGGQIASHDLDRCLAECEAFIYPVQFTMAMVAKGIRPPNSEN